MASERWARGPVTVLTLASFLASLSPARLARAEEEVAAPETTHTVQATAASAPASVTPAAAAAGQAVEERVASSGAVTTAQESVSAIAPPPLQIDSIPIGGADKTGVSSQAISLPQGTGKVQGMGESFSTDPSTGVATFKVPFALEAARGGAQPSLGLVYSSGAGHGIAGVGWDIGVPFIARQTDRGTPRYQDPPAGSAWTPTQDRFVFNGGQELVPICLVTGSSCSAALAGEAMPAWASGWQYFRPRVEGSFLRFFWSPDHRTWRVQSKSGESMELGVPLDDATYTAALEQDPAGAGQIFRWNLVRQYDAYGGANPTGSTPPTPANPVVYRYLTDSGVALVSDIYDTPPAGNTSAPPLSAYAHHVHLSYETRTDPTTSFRRGWQTMQRLRLAGVDVTSATFGGGGARELVRRYHLAYDAGSHVSLLTSVQLEGRCMSAPGKEQSITEDATGALPATSCPTLPPMTFGYSHVQGFDVSGAQQPSDLPGYEPFDERVISFAHSPPNSVDEQLTELFDVNADGLPDVLVTNPAQFGGNLGAYLNGAGGEANAFGGAIPMPVTGVPGEDATTITLANQNISAADVDGMGIVELVHMPQVKTYSVYQPQGSGTSWSWVGRAVTTASQQSPKLDFGSDAQNIHVLDVNGDGLVDLVHTAGTQIETFFSLGRFPGGNGQFGHAQWTGPSSANISNDPVAYCLPYGGLPVQFTDANTKLADMNGDGLPDIVYAQQGNILYWPGRGNGYFGTGDRGACPAGSFGQGTSVAMQASPFYSDPSGSTLRFDDVNGDGLDDLVQVGFDFVEIWLNVDGTSWTAMHTIQGSPPAPSYASRVRLVDANGNGTRDLLWGDGNEYRFIDLQGGVRPWVLTHVQNGLGKTTDIQYASSTQLMLAAAAAGTPWASTTPMPVHVVTQVTDRDNLDIVGRPAGVYVTQYSYRDPVYDGRQREFRGFRTSTGTHVGDSNSPTSMATSTVLLGECANDEGVTPDPCSLDGRWQDNPREALKGLAIVSESHDTSGNYLSTEHTTYRLRKLYTGLDGREVRQAFSSQSDSYLYDTSPFTAASQATTLTDVELEATLGTVTTDTTESLTLRATSGRAHLHKSSVLDGLGNTTSTTDDGCVDGCASQDASITITTVPGRPVGDNSGWIYRTVESYVGALHHTYTQYDSAGSPVLSSAQLQGTLPLDRFHEDPSAAVAPPPATASQDGVILMGASQYDSSGRLVQQTAPNGRCRQVVYDASFDQLPIQETVYVGSSGPVGPSTLACSGTSLHTVAQYDRGLGAVTQVIDLHGELTTATYDGFGRPLSVTKPDPVNPTVASATQSVLIEYFLPSDPTATPYTIVHTQSQDGPDAVTASYHDSWAFADGLGRAIATLDQADPSCGDGGQWIVNGLTDYDAKGAARRAYLAWFWSGTPTQFPLATTPSTAYGSQRYDAFGRKLQTFGLDGAVTLQTAYHALSADAWDAADLMPGPHQGTYASTLKDGHGRTVAVTERVHNGSAIEAHDTRTTYLATGEPQVITRVRVGAADPPVVRWIQYDSLGRMVLNVEPDTTKNFTPTPSPSPGPPPDPSMKAWRYAYDDNGDLVGTSDARGCGANYGYDVGGRIQYEDFSPCLVAHQVYSPPNPATGDGTEAFYEYDALDADAAAIPGFPIDTGLLLGRLVAVLDRGAKTVTRYDGRGRSTGAARRLVAPGTPSNTLASRYTPHWYTQSVTFDGADRPVTSTTGADVAELLDPNGQSAVTTTYSKRGAVCSVTSGYGTLLASKTQDADGLVSQIVYGDAAHTTSSFTYDTRRRLSSVQTYRGPPALWSQQPPAYQPAPDPGGPPSTLQLLLEDVDYVYDAVDNPVEIRDFRNPAEWPAGAQPVTRKIQYDDLYRVTQVAYSYPGGTDSWVSPFDAEDRGIDPDPRRAQPSPHVSFPQRVLSQSFQYDWLGNTTNTDDDAHGFYDRSIGAITNGSASAGPYQLKSATGAASARGGSLGAAYDDAGNLVSMAVSRQGPCLPAGASCTQRFVYDWDEVGHLARARRWDLARSGSASDPIPLATPDADLQYAYNASDERTLKTATDALGSQVFAAYVFGSLELRGAAFDGSNYARTAWTEVPYLGGLARVHYAAADVPTLSSGQQHVLVEIADHLGSSEIVVDLASSELVERSGYLGYGAAESDYRPERWNSYRDAKRFTGKEEDIESGFTYFGKRYLAPALGRWASADPITIHALDADGNAYAYVRARLLLATDPDGLEEIVRNLTKERAEVLGAFYEIGNKFPPSSFWWQRKLGRWVQNSVLASVGLTENRDAFDSATRKEYANRPTVVPDGVTARLYYDRVRTASSFYEVKTYEAGTEIHLYDNEYQILGLIEALSNAPASRARTGVPGTLHFVTTQGVKVGYDVVGYANLKGVMLVQEIIQEVYDTKTELSSVRVGQGTILNPNVYLTRRNLMFVDTVPGNIVPWQTKPGQQTPKVTEKNVCVPTDVVDTPPPPLTDPLDNPNK